MKQRLTALLLMLALVLSLTACGNDKPAADKSDEGVEDAVDQEGTSADDVDGTADESQEAPESEGEISETDPAVPGPMPDEKPVEEEKPVEKPMEKPAKPKPEEKPTGPEAPVGEPASDEALSEMQEKVDLTVFYEAQVASGEWPAMMAMEGEALGSFYVGLSDIATKQCGVYMAAISAAVGEVALVEVENADDVQAVKDIFQARIDYQVGDNTNPGGAWYPASIEGWKNDSRIVSNGNFVMLVVSSNADSMVEAFNALFA